MATNLDLNDSLIEKAQKFGKHRTKKAAVNTALEEYVRRHEQLKILDLVGKVEYWPDYDHKEFRRRKMR